MPSPLSRLKKKTSKEILWIYIFRLLLERDLYGYQLKKELKEKFDIEPAIITSYVVLYRLEREGYVSSRWEKNKRYYHLTEKGRDLYEEGVKYIEKIREKLMA